MCAVAGPLFSSINSIKIRLAALVFAFILFSALLPMNVVALEPGDILGTDGTVLFRLVPDASSGFIREPLFSFDGHGEVTNLTVGVDGTIFLFLDQFEDVPSFLHIDPETSNQTLFLPPEGFGFHTVAEMAVDINGDLLYVPHNELDALVRYNFLTGVKTSLLWRESLPIDCNLDFEGKEEICPLPPVITDFLPIKNLFNPAGLAVDANGRIFLAHSSGTLGLPTSENIIFQVDRTSGMPALVVSKTNLLHIRGMTIDSENKILVSGLIPSDSSFHQYVGAIIRIDPDNGAEEILFLDDMTGLPVSGDIVIDKNDGFLVNSSDSLYRSNSDTGLINWVPTDFPVRAISVVPGRKCVLNGNNEGACPASVEFDPLKVNVPNLNLGNVGIIKSITVVWNESEEDRIVDLNEYLTEESDKENIRWSVTITDNLREPSFEGHGILSYRNQVFGEPTLGKIIFAGVNAKHTHTGDSDNLMVVIYPQVTQDAFTTWYKMERQDTAWHTLLPRVYSTIVRPITAIQPLGIIMVQDPEASCSLDKQRWEDDIGNFIVCDRTCHPGAEYEMRSEMLNGGHGHQAMYDAAGNLIPGGVGAGTADRAHHSRADMHRDLDILPFIWAAQLDANPVEANFIPLDGPFLGLTKILVHQGLHLRQYLEVRPPMTENPLDFGECDDF